MPSKLSCRKLFRKIRLLSHDRGEIHERGNCTSKLYITKLYFERRSDSSVQVGSTRLVSWSECKKRLEVRKAWRSSINVKLTFGPSDKVFFWGITYSPTNRNVPLATLKFRLLDSRDSQECSSTHSRRKEEVPRVTSNHGRGDSTTQVVFGTSTVLIWPFMHLIDLHPGSGTHSSSFQKDSCSPKRDHTGPFTNGNHEPTGL